MHKQTLLFLLACKSAVWSKPTVFLCVCLLFDRLLLECRTQTDYPSFGYMLSQNASTIWESWFWSDNTYSHNHPMFGSVSQWLLQSLAGMRDLVCGCFRSAPPKLLR